MAQGFRGDKAQVARYAISTFGKTLPWAAADSFSLYFLTDGAGVSSSTAGLLVLIFFGWAALCDPIAGWLFDAYRRSGRPEGRYFLVSAVLAGVCFVASFCRAPSGWPAIPFLLTAGLAFRASYAVMDVPHNAFIARLAKGRVNVVSLGAVRLLATLLGALAATVAARPFLSDTAAQLSANLALYAVGVGGVGLMLFLAFFPKPERAEASKPLATQPRPVPRDWKIVPVFFLGIFLANTVAGLFSKDIIYIAKYVFRRPAWTSEAFILFTTGKLAAVLLWDRIARTIGLMDALKAAFGLTAMMAVIAAFLAPWPRVLGFALLVFGLGLGGVNLLSWAVLPSLAPPSESGARFFGLYTALAKVAAGVSGLVLGLLLSSAGAGESSILSNHQAARLYSAIMIAPVVGSLGGLLCIEICARLMFRKRPGDV
jgi:GPH family glycoside/pentoside/hexuronide:cation symporter